MVSTEPSERNNYQMKHITLLRYCFRRLLKRDLIDYHQSESAIAKAIYYAPYIVVSHGIEADPIFNYANLAAQSLFEMTWTELTMLPSRQSAELPKREERARLLDAVTTQGYIENYSGIRISKMGKRFRISDVIVWNLHDQENIYCGQAAVYSQWEYL